MFCNEPARLGESDKAFRLHVGGRFDFDNTWYSIEDLPFQLEDGRTCAGRVCGPMGPWKECDFVTEVNFANIQDVSNEDTSTQVGSVGFTDFYVTFKNVPTSKMSV